MKRIVCFCFAIGLTSVSFAAGGEKKLPLVFEDDFAKGAGNWQPTDKEAWKVVKTDKGSYYSQFQMSKYKPPFRSPHNIALIDGMTMTHFVFEAKVLSTGKDGDHRDMCLFFGYQDESHFYYAHLAKKTDDRANQIFIVNGADRKKISTKTSAGTPWDDKWRQVRVVRVPQLGTIEVYFDDMKTPVMTAEDKTFAWGQVGIGSFDDSGHWTDIKLHGLKHSK
jgi:hypothetical protein